ncbi:phosphoacetylglucosamine mutase [Tribolium castaneum]|uniref:Phosphoacetylglucosamine mutase n=1 Tax=Tribolium castaneum TaxID=7070 RepID=D6X3A7_TRICA|nr:PREDICTED: phosphoacetylglucosamine mutase [Tribolium castaneum]EFA09778.2 Phosphoacetylglucosamine mutase-like Protein [Tribolium castaneum]|eukprot:XP_973346.2 PREDICTED: phosphoacetylglucosamine mutase [Tribolium castaneum]
MSSDWYPLLVTASLLLSHTHSLPRKVSTSLSSGLISMANSYRTVYAFAREMHPKTVKADIQYGTAGFRAKANNLGYVMYRMGLLAVLRARYKRATIGVMITASHNPEPDNGVKLVDPMGEMLEQSWEKWATKFANVGDDQLEETINEIIKEYDIPMTDRVEIVVGKDTRPSSPSLAKSLTDGVLALSGKPVDYGIVTTPQLHYFVVCKNTNRKYGEPTEEGYYTKLTKAFKKLRGETFTNGSYKNRLLYDGANGVGAKKIKYFQELLGNSMKIQMYNDAIIGSGKLNYMCGADYVKSQQKFPTGVPVEPNTRCCSVDGDADRLIYYYMDENNGFHLMDGDRMATLIASYLKEILEKTELDLNLGLVQTAYANGASTEYISKKLQVPVACVSTGVKHLHHKALDYDIGVYFEANGHGTVIFSSNAKDKLTETAKNSSLSEERRHAAEALLTLIDLVNETVGDAISDMLLIETILHAKGWDIQQWESAYTDWPNRLMKVTVQDRNVITTTDAERVCVTPEGLQAEIDALVAKFDKGRSFVRPSGTEDIVRVYAEAATREQADELALQVARKVHEMAGGTGDSPQLN